jgi:hypothetical protein
MHGRQRLRLHVIAMQIFNQPKHRPRARMLPIDQSQQDSQQP